MDVLRERNLDSALKEAFKAGIPILGICIGCQIILTHSEEGDTPCLDILPGACLRFQLSDPTLKIPHMGWNAVTVTKPHPLLGHLRPGDEFYFVHSYYPQPDTLPKSTPPAITAANSPSPSARTTCSLSSFTRRKVEWWGCRCWKISRVGNGVNKETRRQVLVILVYVSTSLTRSP